MDHSLERGLAQRADKSQLSKRGAPAKTVGLALSKRETLLPIIWLPAIDPILGYKRINHCSVGTIHIMLEGVARSVMLRM